MENKLFWNGIKRRLEIRRLKNELQKIQTFIPVDFGGGCSTKKGLLMAAIITEFDLKKTADIGVYRGRSFFPQVIAHKLFTGGVVYGVDPFSNEAAKQLENPDLTTDLIAWAEKTDFEKIFQDVRSLIIQFDLSVSGEIVKKKSSDAIKDFNDQNMKFGLIHIDGNHDTKFVMEDVLNYTPVLEKQGFVVLDDVSWNSVTPAYDFLAEKGKVVFRKTDKADDYAIFGYGLEGSGFKRLERLISMIY